MVPLTEGIAGHPYEWTAEAERVADGLDFVARAAELTVAPALLVVSGEEDHPDLRADAAALPLPKEKGKIRVERSLKTMGAGR